jgi:hypothetical protein
MRGVRREHCRYCPETDRSKFTPRYSVCRACRNQQDRIRKAGERKKAGFLNLDGARACRRCGLRDLTVIEGRCGLCRIEVAA